MKTLNAKVGPNGNFVKPYSLRNIITPNTPEEKGELLGDYSDTVFACKDSEISPPPPPLISPAKNPRSCLTSYSGAGWFSEKLHLSGDIIERYDFKHLNGAPCKFQYGLTRVEEEEDPERHEGALRWYRDKLEPHIEEWSKEYPDREDCIPTIQMTEEEREDERRRHLLRAKKKVQRLVNRNNLHYMWTVTFAPNYNTNVQGLKKVVPVELQGDREEIMKVWSRWEQRFQSLCSEHGLKFKYVMVLERHEGSKTSSLKKGTYHFHIATNMRIDKHLLQKLWGYGIVWIDDFNKSKKLIDGKVTLSGKRDPITDPGLYISKYIGKALGKDGNYCKRSFSCSTGLKQPVCLRDKVEIKRCLNDPIRFYDMQGISINKKFRKEIEQLLGIDDMKVFETEYLQEFPIYKNGQVIHVMQVQVHYELFNFRKLRMAVNAFETGQDEFFARNLADSG